MSMTQLLIPFVALVVAGTGLAQQSRVIPPGLADIEGNLSSTSPFGRTTAGMQFLCDPNVVATAPGVVIDIGLRDGGDQNTYQSYTKQYKRTAAQTYGVGTKPPLSWGAGALLGPYGLAIAAAIKDHQEKQRKLFARDTHLACSSLPGPR